MKRFILMFLFTLFTAVLWSQSGGFNYKILLSDNTGILSEQQVRVHISILDSAQNTVYAETHDVQTDENGIARMVIGEGNMVTGQFSTLDWSGDYALKTEISTDGGNTYTDFGTTPFRYVPYAKYAERAGNVFSGNYDDLTNKPDVFRVLGTHEPARSFTEDIHHEGSMALGTIFAPLGAGQSALRINRSVEDNSDSYGTVMILGGNGGGRHFGYYTMLLGNGSGEHYGHLIKIYNNGNGAKYGTFISVADTTSAEHTGTYNYLNGSGSGIYTGTVNFINTSNDVVGTQIGVRNIMGNVSRGGHFGVFNDFFGYGSGNYVGIYNQNFNTGGGAHYGIKNIFGRSGSGPVYGVYTDINVSGQGEKYGTYVVINSNSGGRHYAIYAEATKDSADVYAGYFKGNVKIENGKLTATYSGDADLKPYIYGSITSSGFLSSNGAHTGGFEVSRVSTGVYRITFDISPGSPQYLVSVNLRFDAIGFVTVKNESNYFTVKTFDTAGNPANKPFNFVVYKP
ncbi:MAG: hypothetical protein GXO24_00650 [Chlorobi bacterium]|nr:hypothetical protein [Chlorobiota bacterium]